MKCNSIISIEKLGNHDKPRFASRYGIERVDGMMMLLLCLPGVAITYNGDEIGMVDYREISWEKTQDPQACNLNDPLNFKDASRDPQRTPFQWDDTAFAGFKVAGEPQPWIEVHPNYTTLNLKAQRRDEKSFFKFYQKLSNFRKNPAFVHGDFQSHAFDANIFAFRRTFEDDTFYGLINFGAAEKTVDLTEMGEFLTGKSIIFAAGSRSSYESG